MWGSFQLGSTSSAIDPVSQALTLTLGPGTLTIPAGSFHKFFGTYLFRGKVGAVRVGAEGTGTGFGPVFVTVTRWAERGPLACPGVAMSTCRCSRASVPGAGGGPAREARGAKFFFSSRLHVENHPREPSAVRIADRQFVIGDRFDFLMELVAGGVEKLSKNPDLQAAGGFLDGGV